MINLSSLLIGSVCGGLFILALAALGGWLIYTTFKDRQKAAASKNWPSVNAQITLSEVRESQSRDSEGDLQTSYYPYVQYTYQIGGVVYQGDKITFGARKMYYSTKKAAAALASYPLGAQVKAFYNPTNLQEAVLEQRSVGSNLMLIFGILLLLAAGCGVCILLGSVISNLASG